MLFLDIETYSSVDLRTSNVYRYTESADFKILMCAWAVDDGPVQVAVGRDQIERIPGLFDPDVQKVAHNAPFERVCFSVFQRGPGQGFLDPADWTDTMVMAAEAGLPQSLSNLARALGASDKDEAGTALINWFCKPDRKGQRRLPADHPEKWEAFVEYCRQDVVTLREVHRALPKMTQAEIDLFLVDQRINDRGVAVDAEMALAAVQADEAGRSKAGSELKALLGIDNPGSVPQVTKGLESIGLRVPNLRAETITELLAGDLPADQRRALELRQQLGLVAAKKYQSVLNSANADGRLRGQFRFFGAHTGRWSSRGVQIQNLPRASVDNPDAAVLDLLLGLVDDPMVLKGLVRSLFTGPFTVVDYASIEARVLAWMAGESWAVEAFQAGRDIYVETANRMGGLTRQQGKVAVLALGYQGGVGSLRNMGGEGLGSDQELQSMVYAWRKANPRIVRLWRITEEAFGEGGSVGKFRFVRDGKDRHMVLPSGRSVVYRNVAKERYFAHGEKKFGWRFDSPLGHRADTYGGRLVENADQAISRDCQAHSLVALEQAGYPVVLHVHDEVGVQGEVDVDTVAKIMCDLPEWADGLPVAAEGFTTYRYRKG